MTTGHEQQTNTPFQHQKSLPLWPPANAKAMQPPLQVSGLPADHQLGGPNVDKMMRWRFCRETTAMIPQSIAAIILPITQAGINILDPHISDAMIPHTLSTSVYSRSPVTPGMVSTGSIRVMDCPFQLVHHPHSPPLFPSWSGC